MWLALALWGAACLGEVRLVGQASYACFLWVSLFALPPLYSTCRTALDALVGEGLALGAQFLNPGETPAGWRVLLWAGQCRSLRGVAGNRPGLCLAGLAALVASSVVGRNWVVRTSVGASAGAAVTLWWLFAPPHGRRRGPYRPVQAV